MVDRANTTATTWLGLTLGCAQCHSHKYDPITHREYYQILAFLNNADEPDYAIREPGIAKRRAEIEAKIAGLTAALPGRFPGGAAVLEKNFAAWEQRESSRAVAWTVVRPSAMTTNMPHLRLLDDGSVLASGDQTKSDTYTLTFDAKVDGVTALRLEVLSHESLPDRGPGRTYYEGRKGDFFLNELTLSVNGKPVRFSGASQDQPKGSAALCIDGNLATGWSTPAGPHAAVFNFAQPVRFDGAVKLGMLFERDYASGLGRFRVSVTTDKRRAEATAHGSAVEAILARPVGQRSPEEREQLRQRFLAAAPELAAAHKEIEALRLATRVHDDTRHEGTTERQPPADAHSPSRRVPAAKGARRARRPVGAASTAGGRPAQPTWPGPLAGVAGQSADRPRHDEPPMASVLRPRPGARRGSRHSGQGAHASGAARLAGP